MPPAVRPTRGLCDLFSQESVVDFIEAVAGAGEVTILAGAGTSIESGFPDWTTLVRRLLVHVGKENGLSAEASQEFARWTTQREGLTAAASVAETALGPAFAAQLHAALYAQKLTPPPGQTALAIAQLIDSFGRDRSHVSTTNYDLVLEAAIESVSGDRAVAATSAKSRAQRRVLHLHGVMKPRGGIEGDLILSERDYFLMQEDSAWQQRYFGERLQQSCCIFVGASLTDPNLLRYLYRSDVGEQHWAIFVRQQDADIYDEADLGLITLREASSEGRWLHAGIRPVHADYFSQSAQLLHEVLHFRTMRARNRKYRPLPERLKRWRRRVNRGALTTQRADFAAKQDELHQTMSDLLTAVRRDLTDAGSGTRMGERLGLSMWAYDPVAESLTNWASSDRVWRDPTTMEPLPIDWTSDFVSTQAFCAGSLVVRSTERYVATRWNHVIGSPIYLETELLGRLPIGAVTIASTASAPESALYRGLSTLRRKSFPAVESVLAGLLDPDAVTAPR